MGFSYLFSKAVQRIGNSRPINPRRLSFFHQYTIICSLKNHLFLVKFKELGTVFKASLFELIENKQFREGLLPDQAGALGKQYAETLIGSNSCASLNCEMVYRYGRYHVCFEDRQKNICFLDEKTQSENVMDPDCLLKSDLIHEFDATQALYIGFLAGLKKQSQVIGSSMETADLGVSNQKRYLYVVK